MKHLLKWIFSVCKLDSFVGKLVSYGLEHNGKYHPEFYHQLNQKLSASHSERLLASVPNKGSLVRVDGKIDITYPKGLRLGNNVHIGDNCYFYCRGGLSIGDNTHISRNVTICTSSHRYQGHALPFDSQYKDKPVRIGRNVWIGMNVNIIPGVTIGEGSVLGMGVTVVKDVAPMSFVGSPTQAELGHRNISLYEELDRCELWSGPNGILLSQQSKRAFGVTAGDLGQNMFFIVSTGRSGSTTIAEALSRNEEVVCKHEPKLELIRLSSDLAHNTISREMATSSVCELYCQTKSLPNMIYGESDQKLSNLIEIIHEVLPMAKFIWLIRNPIDAVNSMYSRGWFSDEELFPSLGQDSAREPSSRHIYSQYRLHADKVGDMSSDEWRAMSPFARACWYWDYWNGLIERQLASLEDSQRYFVRLEELQKVLPKILQFLGAKNQSLIITEPANSAPSTQKLISQNEWDEAMKMDFAKICKPNYERWYAERA